MTKLKPEWIPILKLRSVRDKLAIAIDCDIAPVGDLNIVAELVREGIIVWIDRALLPQLAVTRRSRDSIIRIGINADIYQLTLKGIKLCNENGIKQV